MSITASGVFYLTIRDMFQNDTAVDLLADSIKNALFNNTPTPNFDTNTGYSAAPYTTNELTGTGYTAGGVALASPTITVSSGTLIYDANDVSWSGATFSGARCDVGYDDTIATPTAKPVLYLVNFGADFGVTAGVFTIQWAAGGIFTDDLTPP